jgi:hypothetical protein
MVSVLVAPAEPGITDGGSKEQLTPAGGFEQARLTEPLNPFRPLTGILEFTELPVITVALLGDALRLKPGVPLPCALKVTICITQLPEPVSTAVAS